MKNGWEPGGRLLTAWEEAGCAARASSQLSDHPVVIERIRAAFNALDAARLKAIREETMSREMNMAAPAAGLEPDPPRDFFTEALCIADGGCCLLAQREHIVAVLERFRGQATSVADPVTREQLRESIDVAERARPKSEYDAADRAAQEQVAHE